MGVIFLVENFQEFLQDKKNKEEQNNLKKTLNCRNKIKYKS